jgi:hypothetical protein
MRNVRNTARRVMRLLCVRTFGSEDFSSPAFSALNDSSRAALTAWLDSVATGQKELAEILRMADSYGAE